MQGNGMTAFDSPHHALPDYADLINRLEQIRPKVEADIERLGKTIPDCRLNDTRLTAIAHVGQLIDSTNLAFTFILNHLIPFNNRWWQEVYQAPFTNFTDYHKSVAINNFTVGFIKVGFVQNLFSIIDSTFRILLRELNPAAQKGATTEFFNIHSDLKKEITSFPSDSDGLINVLRLVRNTIHNNGVYFNKRGNDETVTYKGTTYEFKHGKPVDFVTWEWLIDRLDDVRQLLVEVISDPKIISISKEIVDPFSDNRKRVTS